MESIEVHTFFNEIQKLDDKLDDVFEKLNTIEYKQQLCLTYIREIMNGKVHKYPFENAPDDEYLDKFDEEELKQAKEQLGDEWKTLHNFEDSLREKYNLLLDRKNNK